jgi:hypothetical protein
VMMTNGEHKFRGDTIRLAYFAFLARVQILYPGV